MAAHGSKPFVHVSDANGNPYVGAKLYVYEVGTTNLRPIYSNAALSTPISNPLTSDAAGNFARFYQASGTYKLRAETSAAALIWEYDNIDTGIASGNPLAVANGGTGATTAPAARINLGVPSQGEVDDLAAEITTLSNAVQNIAAFPQGYLTVTSGTPVIGASDVTAATTIYYTPYVGAQIPIYNGTNFVIQTFTELSLALNSNHNSNIIYDCFVINDGGTLRLVTGPAWNTSTAGAGARGSGAGTAQLARLNGIWTNAVQVTMRYGATTLSVAANQGTYVGTILIDGSAGQVSVHRAYGKSRRFPIWNAYNRQRIIIKEGESASNWSIGGGGSVRSLQGDATNVLTTLVGLPEEQITVDFTCVGSIQSNQASSAFTGFAKIGIGVNSTSSFSGKVGALTKNDANMSASLAIGVGGDLKARYIAQPAIGRNDFSALEQLSSSLSQTLFGTEANCLMTAEYCG